jgi:DNA polymerase
MFVGEAPGQEEDTQGKPFAGQAGKVLDQALLSAGIRRSEVFITNVVKSITMRIQR